MVDYDELIGKNIARLRGTRSQKEVADAMRAAGWKWSQTTVWSVESGERPLRMAEAIDLADVLETSVMTLVQDRFNIEMLKSRIEKAYETVAADLQRLLYSQLELAASADEKHLDLDEVRDHLDSMSAFGAQRHAARSTLAPLEPRGELWRSLSPVQSWMISRLQAMAEPDAILNDSGLERTPGYDLGLMFTEALPNLEETRSGERSEKA